MKLRAVIVSLVTVCWYGAAALGDVAGGAQNPESKGRLSALEGVLKVHPKFLFKYYITGFGNGQQCALFGEDRLKDIKPGSTIHVEGRLGTRLHAGGKEKNPSPFPRTWYIYMDVDSVKVVRGREARAPEPGAKENPATEQASRKSNDGGLPSDLASFSRILAGKVRAGDSVDVVESLLGSGRSLTTSERATAAAAVLQWQNDQPEYYADGVEDRDVFMRWPIADGCILQLQFRDGRLVNHAPESYGRAESE